MAATPVQELLAQLNDNIAFAKMAAREEVAMIRARAERDENDVFERLFDALRPMRAQREHIIKSMAQIESLTTPALIIPTT